MGENWEGVGFAEVSYFQSYQGKGWCMGTDYPKSFLSGKGGI